MTTSDNGYLALADRLADELVTARPGTKLPSEHDLTSGTGVSRITARAALQELERRHLVRRSRGAGTFVASRIPYPIRDGVDPSWSATVTAAGHEATYRDVQVDSVSASAAIARALGIPRGRAVARVVRLGLVDGDPAGDQTTWVPKDLAPDLAFALETEPSLTRALRTVYGHHPERWWSRAEITAPPAAVADRLKLIGRPPVWRIDSANRCARTGRVLQLSCGWLRTDAFQVFLALGPVDDALPFPENDTTSPRTTTRENP